MHDHCQRSERPDPIQRPVSSHEACMTSNCLLFSEGSSLTIGGAARGGQYRSAPLRPGCAARRGAGMGDDARQPFGSRRVPVHAGTRRPARAEAQGLMMSASRRRLTARPARSVSRWTFSVAGRGAASQQDGKVLGALLREIARDLTEPPRIGSRMIGAEITSSSRIMANGRPTFSSVACSKRFAPSLVEAEDDDRFAGVLVHSRLRVDETARRTRSHRSSMM